VDAGMGAIATAVASTADRLVANWLVPKI